jgi:hypothetical protein
MRQGIAGMSGTLHTPWAFRYWRGIGGGETRGERPCPTFSPMLTGSNDWIPQPILQYCYGTHHSQFLPRGGRRIGMLAIGKTLRDRYDAVAAPVPPQLASLVERLKTES